MPLARAARHGSKPESGPSASGGLSVFAASWSAAQLLIDLNAHERETEIFDGHS